MRGVAAIDVPTVKHWSYITSFIALANSTTKDVFYLRSITPAISLPKSVHDTSRTMSRWIFSFEWQTNLPSSRLGLWATRRLDNFTTPKHLSSSGIGYGWGWKTSKPGGGSGSPSANATSC